MPKVRYQDITFGDVATSIIQNAERLITRYRQQGYVLTLRQLYYQFVAGDLLPDKWADAATGSTNNERSYKKLGEIIANARLAGLIDWNSIEDRTREVDGNPHWTTPAAIVDSAARSFQLDKWDTQDFRVEVWVEKDALEGVVGKAARAADVQFFSCRGYASATSIWDAAMRLKDYAESNQEPVVLHLGDHDPSGIDMSRDIETRLKLFMAEEAGMLHFERIALNLDQVRQYNPPPNPAKITDSRYESYKAKYGEESWELDALEPAVIEALITERIAGYRDDERFQVQVAAEAVHVADLTAAASHWDSKVADFVRGIGKKKR